MSRSADVERRALELFERLFDQEDDADIATLLADEPPAVRERVAALRTAMTGSSALLPTDLPGALFEADAPPPEQVGAFRVVRRIGVGGMGGVWLAERNDGLYEQRVAVKFIRSGLVDLAGAAFRAERQILARLEHPNIARLIDGGVAPDGTPYLVMEYVNGRPIDDAIVDRALAERIKLFVKAADAVQFAHGRLVVHADLKPSNIFVDGQGRVKLLDFGIARLIENEGDETGGAQPMTRAYASPARLAGAAPTIADDVFALGKILAELIAGEKDADLTAIAAMASHPDEARRYGSVGALIADLDRWREQLPVTAREPTIAYRAQKFIAKHRIGVALTTAALLALSAISAVAVRNAVRAETARQEALARFDDARGAARLVSDELLPQLANTPGTFALRSRTVQAVQFYLARLAASSESPHDIRLEAAQGLLHVAEAQAKPGTPNLGLTNPAYANLTRALGLARVLEGEQAKRLHIRILLDRARLLCFGLNNVQAAFRDLDAAAALLGPARKSPDFLRAEYLVELASAREWNSDYPEAIAAARMALRYIPQDDQRDHVLARSTTLDLLAEAIYYSVDGKEAIAPYRQALAVLTSYAARHQPDQIINRRIARAQWALGSTVVDFGDKKEAVAILTEGSKGAYAISRADPNDEDARRMVRIVVNARGQALAASGRVDEGIAIINENIAERRAFMESQPGDPQRMRDYMVAMKSLGDIQLQYGRREDGCATYEQARKLIDTIRARGQLTKLDIAGVLKTMEEQRAKSCG